MSSDTHQIASLLSGDQTGSLTNDMFFSDSQWCVLTDTAGPTQYAATGQINLNTSNLKGFWINYAESVLALQVTVQSNTGTNPYAAAAARNIIATKQQITDFISYFQLRTDSGQLIVNDQGLVSPIRNRIASYVDKSIDWFNASQTQLIGDKDTAYVSTLATNTGFAARQSKFINQATSLVAGVYTVPIYIPLRWLASLMQELDQPITGVSFLMQFGLSLGATFPFSPVLIDPATTDPPRVGIAAPAQLYYRTLSLPLQVQNRVNEKMKAGTMVRKFNFLQSTLIPLTNYQNSTATTITANIGNALVNPRRAFIVGVPAGAAASTTIPFTFAGGLSNVQVRVNNRYPVYTTPPLTPMDFYRLLESQFPGLGESNYCGQAITYGDFLLTTGGYRLHCVDLSYVISNLATPTDGVSLDLTANVTYPAGVTNLDWYVVLDSEVTCRINFGETKTDILVGPNI